MGKAVKAIAKPFTSIIETVTEPFTGPKVPDIKMPKFEAPELPSQQALETTPPPKMADVPQVVATSAGERLKRLQRVGRDRFLTSSGVASGITRSGVQIKS